MQRHKHKGFGLIEVLVSLLLLSTVMLDFLWLEAASLQQLRGSYWENAAYFQLSTIYDRLLASASTQCHLLLQHWNIENAIFLPKGVGTCVCVQQVCTASITWRFHGQHKRRIRMVL